MLSESEAMIIQIPRANFNAKQLIWSKAGKSFILLGKDSRFIEDSDYLARVLENNDFKS